MKIDKSYAISPNEAMVNPTTAQLVKFISKMGVKWFNNQTAKKMVEDIAKPKNIQRICKEMEVVYNDMAIDIKNGLTNLHWYFIIVDGEVHCGGYVSSNTPIMQDNGEYEGERFYFVYEKKYTKYNWMDYKKDIFTGEGLDCEWVNMPYAA